MFTKEYLIKEYIENQRSMQSIATETGVGKHKVGYWLRKFEIPTRKGGRRRVDVCGRKFGSLEVLSPDEKSAGKHPKWICKCDCGDQCTITTGALLGGQKSCWKCRNERISRSKWKGYGEISGEFWGGVQRSAISRGIGFEITGEYAWGLFLKQDRKCALTGVSIKFMRTRSKRSETTASLDRIDSLLGYIEGNVQWVHKTINNLKMDLPQIEFVEWCNKVSEYRRENP